MPSKISAAAKKSAAVVANAISKNTLKRKGRKTLSLFFKSFPLDNIILISKLGEQAHLLVTYVTIRLLSIFFL